MKGHFLVSRTAVFITGVLLLSACLGCLILKLDMVCATLFSVILLSCMLPCIYKGRSGTTMFVFLAMNFFLEAFFYFADKNREYIVYSQLKKLGETGELNSRVTELFHRGYPRQSLLEDPAFHGNLLMPWLPEQPSPIQFTHVVLLLLAAIFFLHYYCYCRVDKMAQLEK